MRNEENEKIVVRAENVFVVVKRVFVHVWFFHTYLLFSLTLVNLRAGKEAENEEILKWFLKLFTSAAKWFKAKITNKQRKYRRRWEKAHQLIVTFRNDKKEENK